jgi:DNA-binding transcriptional MerR regulator
MIRLFVKELSTITGVTVQTLHHYDRINLLKPSLRALNGYRIYSEKDLLKLQQIMALKFFGFKLSEIKGVLKSDDHILDHFLKQAEFLEKKARNLLDASQSLKSIIQDVENNKSIPWETVIKLIEVYKMTEQLQHSWVKEIFTNEELKQYADFEANLKSHFQTIPTFEKDWDDLVEEIENNLNQNPESEVGFKIGERAMKLTYDLYGKQYIHLRNKKWEKGFAEGKGLNDIGLTAKSLPWLEKATDYYWYERIYATLNMIDTKSDSEVLSLWNAILGEMYGEDTSSKQELLQKALVDEKVCDTAKTLLKSISKI